MASFCHGAASAPKPHTDPSAFSLDDRPRLASKARLVRDRSSGSDVLLYPERGLQLNAVAAAVVRRLSGERTVAGIAIEVAAEVVGATAAEVERDVLEFLAELSKRGLVEVTADRAALPAAAPSLGHDVDPIRHEHPYTLIAEAPIAARCAAPTAPTPWSLRQVPRISSSEWCRVFAEAAELGVMQVHLTGGEPLARRDIEVLAKRAREVGLYTNLVTSGIPLTRERLLALAAAGVEHVQLSVQDATPEDADCVAGYPAFSHKIAVAGWVKAAGLPLTVNVVLHRDNLDRVPNHRARRATWRRSPRAGQHAVPRVGPGEPRSAPSHAGTARPRVRLRVRGARPSARAHGDDLRHPRLLRRLASGLHGRAGRGATVHITPTGLVLPCHAAHTLPGLRFETVRDRPLADVWKEAPGLNHFRGDQWMPEPCSSCPRKIYDHGGCRCQAYRLTGDAAATDPACSLSPAHGIIEAARLTAASPRTATEPRYLYRTPPRVLPAA